VPLHAATFYSVASRTFKEATPGVVFPPLVSPVTPFPGPPFPLCVFSRLFEGAPRDRTFTLKSVIRLWYKTIWPRPTLPSSFFVLFVLFHSPVPPRAHFRQDTHVTNGRPTHLQCWGQLTWLDGLPVPVPPCPPLFSCASRTSDDASDNVFGKDIPKL